MSQETIEWLNTMTLIGHTDKRGNAWHYRESAQGGEPNHYAGAVPIEDVKRRLFNFQLVERPLYIVVPCEMDEATTVLGDGSPAKTIVVEDRKAIMRDDVNSVLGIFKGGYKFTQYQESLLSDVQALLGDGLNIGSAGLLKGGAVAWVQIEAEDTVTSCGVEFRPFIMGADSCDGSLARTYNKGNQVVVCDNTMSASLETALATFKLKHTKHATFNAVTARDALGIIEEIGATFTESIEALTNWAVTDAEWTLFLDQVCKFDADAKTTRSATIAQNKRDDLRNLWENDLRVKPWAGTAFGVLQATNTWAHHVQTVRGANRAERNMLNAITGATGKADTETLKILELVCA
jgi:phage/plasmid-like protein (TIGR03299 family)